MLRTALHIAAARGYRDVIDELTGAHLDARDRKSKTPLHYATASIREEEDELWDGPGSVELLIDAGADVNVLDATYMAPLHYAARNGDIAIVNALLAAPDVQIDIETDDQTTPLLCAAQSGSEEVVQVFLAAGANLHAAGTVGYTALHFAAETGEAAPVRVVNNLWNKDVCSCNYYGLVRTSYLCTKTI